MFTIPFILVFTKSDDELGGFEFFADVCFLLDTVLNFFKLGPG